jgi:integrase
MIFGIAGACRREELSNLRVQNIEDKGDVMIINIPNTKTNIPRTFTVMNEPDEEEIHFLEIIRKYIQLRPSNSSSERFFHAFRNGKCVNQLVGINTMGKITSKIAQFLKIQDPQCYTGHAFRRTSATFLANAGVDVLGLKRHGGWKSSAVAEGYVEDSIQNKKEFCKKILHNATEVYSASSSTIIKDVLQLQCNALQDESRVMETEASETINLNSNFLRTIGKNEAPVVFNNCTFNITNKN